MRVVLSWLVSLFRCPGCAAKDSELMFLRNILTSMRSIVRDATPAPHGIKNLVDDGGMPTQPQADGDDGEQPKQPLWFGREAVQDLILAND